MTSPFLSIPRALISGEIAVLAAHVVYVEISVSRTTAQLVLGLTSGRTIESNIFEPTDQTMTRLREFRDQIIDDLIERLSSDDKTPQYAPLPQAGA